MGVLSAAAILAAPARGEMKFISILRGEPKVPSYQRVAFAGKATVREVRGTAERLCGIDCWAPIQAGAHLQPGDVIRAASGTVVLKMERSESFVRINANTILRLVPANEPMVTGTALAGVNR